MNPLLALLNEEVAALRAVLATLQAERQALEARAPDALLEASNAKAEAVARAARLEQERRDFTVAHPDAQADGLGQVLGELRQLAASCRQQNEANGFLIRGQRRRVEGSLNVLRGGSAVADTYGRDGEARQARGPRAPLAAY